MAGEQCVEADNRRGHAKDPANELDQPVAESTGAPSLAEIGLPMPRRMRQRHE